MTGGGEKAEPPHPLGGGGRSTPLFSLIFTLIPNKFKKSINIFMFNFFNFKISKRRRP